MRYSQTYVCCLFVALFLTASLQSSANAQTRDEAVDSVEPAKPTAPRTTRFFLFNTTAGGSYQVLKNGSLLTTTSSSPFGILTLIDITDSGDRFVFTLDGVQTQPPSPPIGVAVVESNPACATVSWLPNGEPDLGGYRVYYGTQSVEGGQAPTYSDSINVGIVTAHELCSLAAGTYYFAVKAHNVTDQYSAYSSEVSITIVPPDVEVPQVSITSPSGGVLLMGIVNVDVNASDNVGVAGVRLHVDGVAVGAEDTQAPFQLSFSSPSVADGPHALTAVARDAAGNTATSAPVFVFSDNEVDPDHPAILLSSSLGDLRGRACYDSQGNVIPACTPSDDWTTFDSHVSQYVSTGTYSGMRAWHFALVYRVTKDTAYAQRAIALLEAEIANGFVDERANDYENAHAYLRDAALVYDWAHPLLDAQQEGELIDYVNQIVYEIWDPAGNPYNVWSGAEVDSPGSYRYHRFLLGTALAAVATDSENTTAPTLTWRGTPYNDLASFVIARLDQEALPEWLATRGKGGGWHEGDYFGLLAKLAMTEVFAVLKYDGREDYFASSSFSAESQLYQFYSMQPANQVKYGGGDSPLDPANSVGDLDRRLMLFHIAGFENQTEGQYAQYWLDNASTSMQSAENYVWDFLLTRSAQPSLDYQQLPLGYHAEGLGWFNTRSSWLDDAVSVSFVSGDHASPAQHFDQNAFSVYHQGWLATDANTHAASGVYGETDAHNTLLIDGFGQRPGDGAGSIAKQEVQPGHAYVVGDASDAYHNGGGQSLLQTYQRELVHIHPDYIVVYDRITPVDSNSTVAYLLHTPLQPTINGDEVVVTYGPGRLFHRTVMPAGAVLSAVQEQGGPDGLDSWRVEITPAQSGPATNFMSVMYPTASSTGAMPPVTAVSAASGNMVGVQIEAGPEDIVVMFSSDPVGAPPTNAVIYDVGMNGVRTDHSLHGLRAGVEYAVTIVPGFTSYTVVVAEGRGQRASGAGVLRFQIDAEASVLSSLDTPVHSDAPGRR